MFAHLLHDFCWVFVWAHLGELSSKLWNPGDKIWAELPSKGWGDLAEWIVHGTCLARKKLGCKQPKKKTSLRVIPAPAHYSDIVSDTIWKYIYIYMTHMAYIHFCICCQTIRHSFSNPIWHLFWHTFWHIFWHSLWHSICHRLLTWRYSVRVQAWPSASGSKQRKHRSS